MKNLWTWIKKQLQDDDWWDLIVDPFVPTDLKLYLLTHYPEKFPCNWNDPRLPTAFATMGVVEGLEGR